MVITVANIWLEALLLFLDQQEETLQQECLEALLIFLTGISQTLHGRVQQTTMATAGNKQLNFSVQSSLWKHKFKFRTLFLVFRSGQFPSLCNSEKVDLEDVKDQDVILLKHIVQDYYSRTNSIVAKTLLENWRTSVRFFVKV